MESLTAKVAAGLSVDRIDLDRPTLGSRTAGQALERESVRLEAQDHLVPTQSAHGFTHTRSRDAHERDRAAASRSALQ
jgi:hypothetical protein